MALINNPYPKLPTDAAQLDEHGLTALIHLVFPLSVDQAAALADPGVDRALLLAWVREHIKDGYGVNDLAQAYLHQLQFLAGTASAALRRALEKTEACRDKLDLLYAEHPGSMHDMRGAYRQAHQELAQAEREEGHFSVEYRIAADQAEWFWQDHSARWQQ